MENRKKFEKLMTNQDFILKILNLRDSQDMKTEFETNGVKISDDELQKFVNELGSISEIIDDEDLDSITGGQKTLEDVTDKTCDKLSKGIGHAAWIIPTAALTIIVSIVVKRWVDKKLEDYKKLMGEIARPMTIHHLRPIPYQKKHKILDSNKNKQNN